MARFGDAISSEDPKYPPKVQHRRTTFSRRNQTAGWHWSRSTPSSSTTSGGRKSTSRITTGTAPLSAGLLGAVTLFLGAVLNIGFLGVPPADAAPVTITAVSAGNAASSACALTSTGGVECWGANSDGQLGNGTTTDSSVPVAVSGLSSGVSAISDGGIDACALTSTGGVECWGDNSSGELGNDAFGGISSVPVAVSGLSSGVRAISVGYFNACALTAAGGVECWGDNDGGQLGNGTTTPSAVPVAVSGLSSGVSAISVAYGLACALTTAGGVECWGNDGYDLFGTSGTTESLVPVAVNCNPAPGGCQTPSGLSSGVAGVSIAEESVCALTTAGGVECVGQLAVNGLPTSGVSAISDGVFDLCALASTGGVECWGDNTYGERGSGTISGVSAISAGYYFTCAVTSAGGVECWGHNSDGELGNGTTTDSSVPVSVSVQPIDTLTFNSEGGSAVDSLDNLDGATITLPGAPTFPGYVFTGWNSAANGSGSDYGAGASYTVSGSSTLYAQWGPAITTVGLPSNGASVSGDIWLDASASTGASTVQYELTGGGLHDSVIASGTSTSVGWLAAWDTVSVPNGTYTLHSVASYPGGITATSVGVSVSVENGALGTQVLVPSAGATLSGTAAVLDAAAAGTADVTRVQFVVTGGSLSNQVVGTAVATLYGWIAEWNTTTVANGAYTIESVATEAGGTTAMSAPIDVTMDNAGT